MTVPMRLTYYDEPLWIAGPEFNRVEVLAIVKREPRMAEHIGPET